MGRSATKIWCPNCDRVGPCRSVTYSDYGHVNKGQRWYKTDNPDIRWFERLRVCENCDYEFFTAELPRNLVHELSQLRDSLKELKKNAAEYEAEAKKAATKLRKFGKSLAAFKVLE